MEIGRIQNDYFYVKYGIDKQRRYYNLAVSNETFKTRAEAMTAVEKLTTSEACRLHLLGPYILILKKPIHIGIDENLRGLSMMIERHEEYRQEEFQRIEKAIKNSLL